MVACAYEAQLAVAFRTLLAMLTMQLCVYCTGMSVCAIDMVGLTVRSRAVAGGIDTRGLFAGASPATQPHSADSAQQGLAVKHVSWPQSLAGAGSGAAIDEAAADTSKLTPQVAELVNIARFASSQPLYGLGSRAPAPATTAHTSSAQITGALGMGMGAGDKFAEARGQHCDAQQAALSLGQAARLEQRQQAQAPTAQERALATAQESLRHNLPAPHTHTGAVLSIKEEAASIPAPTAPGGVAAARQILAKSSVHVVAEYWREHYQELIKVDQIGTKRKMTDLGRGRGYDHVPSALAPLLSGVRLAAFGHANLGTLSANLILGSLSLS